MQSKANMIFREETKWKDKAVKLNDLRKTIFKEFMKSLNLSCKRNQKIILLTDKLDCKVHSFFFKKSNDILINLL